MKMTLSDSFMLGFVIGFGICMLILIWSGVIG